MITQDEIRALVRAVVATDLRPTYCREPATFYPHLWVEEAMRLAYQRGYGDGTAACSHAIGDNVIGALADLEDHTAELAKLAADQLSHAVSELPARVVAQFAEATKLTADPHPPLIDSSACQHTVIDKAQDSFTPDRCSTCYAPVYTQEFP